MPTTHRPLLVVGPLRPDVVETVKQVASEAALRAEVVGSPAEAAPWLSSHDPFAIVLDMAAAGAEAACIGVRMDPRLARVPVLGLAPEVDVLAFGEVFSWGGDDVVPVAAASRLLPRLRLLVASAGQAASLHPPPPRGGAVVADVDRRRRVVMARVLRNAGYDVRFAVDGPEAAQAGCAEGVALVVAEEHLAPDGAAQAARRSREQGGEAAWVVCAEPRHMPAVRVGVAGLPKVAVTDSFAPPENVLFVANELARAGGAEGRKSARVLYGTTVAFRVAGRDEDDVGFSYNMSAEGIYVRTLAPLAGGEEVWLEMCPPRTDRRVRLEGKVAWRRQFGPVDTATVPPGFGVRITDGAAADRDRYRAGYDVFLADTTGGNR